MISVLANVFKVCMRLNCTFNQRKKNKKLHCYNIQSNSMFDDYQMVQKHMFFVVTTRAEHIYESKTRLILYILFKI